MLSAIQTVNSVKGGILCLHPRGVAMRIAPRTQVQIMRQQRALLLPFVNRNCNSNDGEQTDNDKKPFHTFKMGSHTHFCKDGALTC